MNSKVKFRMLVNIENLIRPVLRQPRQFNDEVCGLAGNPLQVFGPKLSSIIQNVMPYTTCTTRDIKADRV